MKTITQEYQIASPVEKVWKALVNCEDISEWGAGPCKMDDKVGTEFTLWGGDIHGKNIEVVPNEKLVQDWYGGDWSEPSTVIFYLEKKGGGTLLKLFHERVPDNEYSAINKGWIEYYLGPLKEYVENEKN